MEKYASHEAYEVEGEAGQPSSINTADKQPGTVRPPTQDARVRAQIHGVFGRPKKGGRLMKRALSESLPGGDYEIETGGMRAKDLEARLVALTEENSKLKAEVHRLSTIARTACEMIAKAFSTAEPVGRRPGKNR